MSESPRPNEAEMTGNVATKPAAEQSVTPDSRQGTPRVEKSIFRRIADSKAARPVAALLGLGMATTGVGLAVNSGGSEGGSTKAPDAIVSPVPDSLKPLTPDDAATKAMLEQVTTEQKGEQGKAQQPEMSEDEKAQRINEILQANYRDLLPFVEAGLTPFYDKGSKHGVDYEVVSFFKDDDMKGVSGLNARFIDAITRHQFDVVMAGIDLKHFPRVAEGSKDPDMKVSEKNQKIVRQAKGLEAVIVPQRINGQDTPWPWEKGGAKDLGMFTVDTEWPPVDDNKAEIRLMFHPDKVSKQIVNGEEVRATGLWLGHHIDDEPEPNAPSNGAS